MQSELTWPKTQIQHLRVPGPGPELPVLGVSLIANLQQPGDSEKMRVSIDVEQGAGQVHVFHTCASSRLL